MECEEADEFLQECLAGNEDLRNRNCYCTRNNTQNKIQQ